MALPRLVRRQKFREAIAGYLFLLPGLIPMVVFVLMPLVSGFAVSLTEWNLVQPWKFVGLRNYRELLTDAEFWRAMRVSATFMLVIPIQTVVALAVALALNQRLRGTVVYRTIYFMPVVTSTVAIALLWQWLYADEIGLINSALNLVGIDGPDWLGSTTWALPAVMLMTVWKSLGYTMVLFLAGLQGIPEHFYDAAKVDGAGTWSRFRHVTLPLLSPTTFFVVIVGVIGALQVFDQVFVMTEGGPYRTTATAAYFIFENGFQLLKMGYASAAAWILFAVIFIVTLVQWRLQSKWVHYE